MSIVKIKRETLGAAGEFMSMNKKLLLNALTVLTHSELRLYLYLVSNRDGYTLPFSKQLIQNEIRLSKNGFYSARDGLMAKGFLEEDGAKNYIFYERSRL